MSKEAINQLICNQSDIGDKIIKSYTNYGKLPIGERQKLAVVCDRIRKVCDLFKLFEDNNSKLEAQRQDIRKDEYFTSKYFDRLKQLHEEKLAKMLEDKNRLEAQIPPINEDLLPQQFRDNIGATCQDVMETDSANQDPGTSTIQSQGRSFKTQQQHQQQLSTSSSQFLQFPRSPSRRLSSGSDYVVSKLI